MIQVDTPVQSQVMYSKVAADTTQSDPLMSVRGGGEVLTGSAMIHQSVVDQSAFTAPLPSGVGSTKVMLGNSFFSTNSATIPPRYLKDQMPDALSSGVGRTQVLSDNPIRDYNTATIQRKPFILEQMLDPLPPGEPPPVLPETPMQKTEVMPFGKSFLLEQEPPPLPNRIGEEDLTGGFKRDAILNGMSAPLYDLARGIVQIDGVAVLFDARM